MLTEPEKHHVIAERVHAALDQIGRTGQRFILPWRIDENQQLRQAQGMAECGCGISQDDPLLR